METMTNLEARRVYEAVGVRIETELNRRTPMERKLVETWDGTKEWARGVCKVCSAPMADEVCRILEMEIPVNVCASCAGIVSDHYSPDRRPDLQTVTQSPWWDEHCPPNYRELITQKRLPPQCDVHAIKKVMAWNLADRRGLLLMGASGIGKTLSLWAKARDLERIGTKSVFLSAVEFARKLAVAARDLDKADWLIRCEVLIVDDLGKEKLSAAVAPLIWEVIDARMNHRRPTLISTRFRGTAFVERFTDAILGEDIRGRISDSAQIVNFGIDTQ
jgi:hypothetical protein